MRFEVFMVVSRNIPVFWDVTPYSLVEVSEELAAFILRTGEKTSLLSSVFRFYSEDGSSTSV